MTTFDDELRKSYKPDQIKGPPFKPVGPAPQNAGTFGDALAVLRRRAVALESSATVELDLSRAYNLQNGEFPWGMPRVHTYIPMTVTSRHGSSSTDLNEHDLRPSLCRCGHAPGSHTGYGHGRCEVSEDCDCEDYEADPESLRAAEVVETMLRAGPGESEK